MENMLVAEVAAELRVTERTVRRWIADGTLAASKKGGRVLVARAALEQMQGVTK